MASSGKSKKRSSVSSSKGTPAADEQTSEPKSKALPVTGDSSREGDQEKALASASKPKDTSISESSDSKPESKDPSPSVTPIAKPQKLSPALQDLSSRLDRIKLLELHLRECIDREIKHLKTFSPGHLSGTQRKEVKKQMDVEKAYIDAVDLELKQLHKGVKSERNKRWEKVRRRYEGLVNRELGLLR